MLKFVFLNNIIFNEQSFAPRNGQNDFEMQPWSRSRNLETKKSSTSGFATVSNYDRDQTTTARSRSKRRSEDLDHNPSQAVEARWRSNRRDGFNATTTCSQGPSPRPRFASLALLSPFIPEADPQNSRAQTFKAWHSRRDIALKSASMVATIVLLTNFVGTLVLAKAYKNSIFRGDCNRTSAISTGIHVLINVLASLLLGASNLCMQLLVAPTRSEIDKAHRKQIWLDIGIPSIRNLPHIARRRRVIWWILGISSLPLHFL
jgi:hypothetical protein